MNKGNNKGNIVTIKMKNEQTGEVKEVPIGFSWTTLFFGWFPALLRGDWKNFMILFFLTIPTFGIILVVYCFKYNMIYTSDLIGKGYKAVMSTQEAEFMSVKIGVYLPVVSQVSDSDFQHQADCIQKINELAD